MTDVFSKAGLHLKVISKPLFPAGARQEIIPLQFNDREFFLRFVFIVMHPK